ncbi:Crp/Fnr family transcriptional regulator [Chroogloeocystis siderophila]|jgi:CRP-like cAMP-binding protein|uniref:Replication/maintenance protein n=1 Tax=Chroogloeocystis siderophila 5.2 s.c.1 TaxID=247279 RepID=A0A1U7HRV7_9CHRO|nr:Crp/Fnr family transcriptional regulator [Chroogloeocystis siderophila]OKH26312.1 replication/maintenance protein [Chroogloeocystis siderophila 5.2 s.c.1]
MTISAPNPPLPSPISQRIFSRKELIPPRQDLLWKIERGAVRTFTWSEQGTLITLGYWGTDDVVGYPLSRINPYQIECLTSVEMSLLPAGLWHQAVDSMLLHIQQSEELLSIVHRKPVSMRLWHFLIWLSEKFGREVEQGRLIDLAITHQEIAEVINTTRVSVTRLLQQFEEEGMLLRHQRRLILCLIK